MSQVTALLLILGIIVLLVGVVLVGWGHGLDWVLGLPFIILGLYAVYTAGSTSCKP
ncbi:hypothetical protein [Pyrobaculum calidifontis]|uniref:hypothetical protein n=1 Tax=Pyrobaculum calidifontis TaxID=181486 RepID=UPI00186BAE8E|nr:hypothetical protein [Pyrobaculum calidifontis]